MTIDDVQQGMRLAHDEATKSKLTGQVVITLSYNDGGLAKCSKQVNGPLLPGTRPINGRVPGVDKPRENFG